MKEKQQPPNGVENLRALLQVVFRYVGNQKALTVGLFFFD